MRQTEVARDSMEKSTEGFLGDAENLLDDLSGRLNRCSRVCMKMWVICRSS